MTSIRRFDGEFANYYKHVTVRTIKMTEATVMELRTSSKFNRSRGFIDRLTPVPAPIAWGPISEIFGAAIAERVADAGRVC